MARKTCGLQILLRIIVGGIIAGGDYNSFETQVALALGELKAQVGAFHVVLAQQHEDIESLQKEIGKLNLWRAKVVAFYGALWVIGALALKYLHLFQGWRP